MLALLPTFLTMQLVSTQANSIPTSPAAAHLYVALQPKPATPVPSFDDEQLKPLRLEQSRLAAIQAAQALEAQKAVVITDQALKTNLNVSKIVDTGDGWALLRKCEAGGNYAANTGNGYYGAYQANIGTWGGFGGYARPDLAPPEVQDAFARGLYAARGSQPWPSCGRYLP